MRKATDRGAFFKYWEDAVNLGVKGAIHPDTPQGGFYRHKAGMPVAIWIDQELEEGELAAPEEVRCLIGVNGKAELHGYDKAMDIWNWIAGRPIAEDTYRRVYRDGIWPGEDHGLPNRPADTSEELFDQIDSAVSLIGLFPPVETKEDADRVANARDRLNELYAQAEALRKAEKKPHDDACKAVQAKFKPYLDAATQAVAYCRTLLTPFMRAQEAREVQEAAKQAEPTIPGKVRVGGASGRRTGLKTVTRVEITDYEAALAHVKHYEDVKEAVRVTVTHLAKAGAEVPGVKIIKEKVAQ